MSLSVVYNIIRAKIIHSVQSYIRAMWVNTQKRQTWLWGEIITCWIPD